MVLRKTGDVWQKKRSLDSLGKILKRVKFFKTMMMRTSCKRRNHIILMTSLMTRLWAAISQKEENITFLCKRYTEV